MLEITFWACVACIAYPYVIYPLVLAALARRGKGLVRDEGENWPSVSVVMAARNEAASIGRRVREFAAMIASSGLRGEVIVVSDGSTDETANAARLAGGELVRVLELADNVGKSAALSAGCAAASHEILVLADTRQSWASDALKRLLENLGDPSVGGVGGHLILETDQGALAGVGVYWRFEKWLRRTESRLHSSIGLTGAICAVRRELFRPIPRGILLDDVYWPLQVVMQGYRVVQDDRALAYDRLPDRVRDEFRRKVRTLSGNYQLLVRLPAVLLPWRNPIWWQFVSHKLARLLVPWALLGAFGIAAALGGSLYHALFLIQVVAYLGGLTGVFGFGTRIRAISVSASFLILNAAAWMAFWVWFSGRATQSWGKVAYEVPGVDFVERVE
ncbi:Glycosyltransferase, catalytic subunit of cellulose synthase and poly-beta-1,6-N-acetylglucosamine synthase [Singulisphaera sp. GP187]|uniref:glycosyltransferase n=1 Tax=Singulisphaera sp. GP187 TaxID=1882752 RepID=UPI00092B7A5E|nr:glycosyltransferase [Singulisphaera sp. GP187]SIO61497.1 Glycosyltransferase, catalytic subunit of cellulose synthase and poly-beta-1,6-N-acetylglucosamine synthase [Singulisphaera sp. GP187]